MTIIKKGMIVMAAMLIFTLVMNLFAWAAFTLTDVFLSGYSFVNMIVLAEWFVMPMAASAIYRAVTDRDGQTEQADKIMYMLMWFVMSTGFSGVIYKARETGRWFEASVFNSFDYLTFASALVFGFIVYSIAYEIVGFFVDGGFAAHRAARGR